MEIVGPVFQHVCAQTSHDPDRKIKLSGSFKNVKIKTCLYKEYPTVGDYEGGIVFKRYFGFCRFTGKVLTKGKPSPV